MDISEPGASSINVQPDLEQPLERGKIATLPELYKHAIDKITLFLDKDPWIAREIESALILDDCLIRLKIWSQEIGSEMVLAQVEKHVVLYSPTKYFLVHINNAIKDFVSLREDIAGWPTTRVGEIRDVLSRLRQYVTNLSSHIIPFVAVGESANRAGPIYELHTRKNKTPRLATSISKIAPPIISKGSQNTVEVLLPVDAAEPQGVREEELHQLFMASEGLSHLKGSDTADAMMRVVYSVLSRHSLFHSFPFMNLNERGKRLIRWCRIKDEKEASLLARYEYRLLGSRCSLRMLKLLPTLFGEVIKCELTEVHPRDVQPNQPLTWNCEPFEAISWVWSRDERNRTICIGDALRLDDKPRHIWIDFLCSDRSNPQELSDQPFIFHSIFAAAEGVCAWLGNGNDNSDLAINFIKTTSSTHDSWQRSRNEETKETFVQGVALVEIFLSQPWFSRRWIIQEVAWAQRCMLYCGQNSLSWEELSEWAEAFGMFLTKSLPCGAMTAPNDLNNGFRMIDVINKAFRCGSSNGSRSYMLDLEYLVTSLAPFEVSIPHDQVYALLSLASRQPPGRPKTKFPSGAYGEPLVVLDKRNMNMVGYHVDYNQPYDEFCKEFVQFSVMMSSSIDIICRPWAANLDLSRIKLPSQGIQLPSWIATINRANLTHQPVNGDILVKLQGPSQTRYMSSGGKQVDFTSLRFKKYCSGWSLFVRGFVLDEVKQKSVASQEGNIPYEWSKFAKWEDFDNDPPDGYWRTLVADQGTSTTTAAPSFYRRAVKDLYSGAAKKGFDILAQQTIQSDVGRVVRNVMEKIQSIICNRSLARIGHSGALGLVPRDTQIGDLICVLYGCSVPVVLRRFPKTEEEIWEQRAENIREEQAAVVIQRAYRSRLCLIYKPKSLSAVAGPFKDRPTQHCTMAEIQLRRLNRQLGPDQPQPQDRKAESATSMRKSITREGKWSSRIRCSAIILVFMCTTRVWPMDSSLGPPLGLLAFVVIAFMEVSRANEHQIAQKEEVVPEESTLKTPTKPRLLPLSLSKRPDYYYYKVIGESYVHGMMYGEAIRLQEKERIPEQVFELR